MHNIYDCTYLWVDGVVVLLRPDPPGHQTVPDRVGQSVIVIPDGGYVSVLDQREVQVPVERFLHGHHILDVCDGLDADLFALFHFGLADLLHRRHFDAFQYDLYPWKVRCNMCRHKYVFWTTRIEILSVDQVQDVFSVDLLGWFLEDVSGRCRWPVADVLWMLKAREQLCRCHGSPVKVSAIRARSINLQSNKSTSTTYILPIRLVVIRHRRNR